MVGVGRKEFEMIIMWDIGQRDEFALAWPCCDVPESGWIEIDSGGGLIDFSDNCIDCDGGGFAEFTLDLQKKLQ